MELFINFTEFFISVELFFNFTVFYFCRTVFHFYSFSLLRSWFTLSSQPYAVWNKMHLTYEVWSYCWSEKLMGYKLQFKFTWNQKTQQSSGLITPSNPMCLYGMNPSSTVGPLLQLKASLPAQYAGYICTLYLLNGFPFSVILQKLNPTTV